VKTKSGIRQDIGRKRAALDIWWLEKTSAEIVKNFQSLDVFQSSKTVALYKAIGGEVNLEPLFKRCWSLNKRTVIPVFNATDRVYEMAEISSATTFVTGNYGIQEPVNPEILDIRAIDLIAVPGVAFDLNGNRLGRGGGYYDRMLEPFSGSAAGICFDFQVLDKIPIDPHDRPVSFLVTETYSIKVSNER